MGPKFKLRNFRCHASHIGPLIFQRLCDDYQCLILLFSVTYLNSWGYIGWGPPSRYLKIFILSFLFVLFYLFFFLFFFSSLSGAPLAPRPLDIVHPRHPVATPLFIGGAYMVKCYKYIYQQNHSELGKITIQLI